VRIHPTLNGTDKTIKGYDVLARMGGNNSEQSKMDDVAPPNGFGVITSKFSGRKENSKR
jgi:hypothetical protein